MAYLKNQFSSKVLVAAGNWEREAPGYPRGTALSDNGDKLVAAAGTSADGGWVFTYALVNGLYTLSNSLDLGYVKPWAISISGNGLIMAVGFADTPTTAGSVRIYDWSGTAWVLRGSALVPADAALADAFGASVRLSSDGTHLFVGATGWEGTQTNQGGVYEFFYDGAAWSQVGSVITTATASGFLGSAVCLSSDRTIMAIGAAAYSTNKGRVQIFEYNGSSWALRNTVTASDGASNDLFGNSVALNKTGTTLIVGASDWEGTTGTNTGAVYTYVYANSSWTQFEGIKESPVKIERVSFYYSRYGAGLSISTDYSKIAIGALGEGYTSLAYLVVGDFYSYEISGTVIDDTNAPVQRTITAHLESTGECVNSVVSAANGTYAIAVPKTGKYFLVCQDDTGGTSYNALVYSGIEVV